MFNSRSTGDQPLDRLALLEVLLSITRIQRRTYIIVDAIDEGAGREEILETLTIMAVKKSNNLHILISSQLQKYIEERLQTVDIGRVSIGDSSLDSIRLHIVRSIHDDSKIQTWDDSLRCDVENRLVDGAGLG